VLPAGLAHGAGAWQNNHTLHDLLGSDEFHGFVPSGAALLATLRQNAEGLLESGRRGSKRWPYCGAGEEATAFERVFTEAMRRLEAGRTGSTCGGPT